MRFLAASSKRKEKIFQIIKMYKMKLRDKKHISYYEPEEPPFDEYIYCEKCGDVVYEYCSVHGPLLVIPDDKVAENTGMPKWVPRAALTTPHVFLHIAPSIIPGAGLGVFSSLTLPRGVRFGPYRGKRTKEISSAYCWQLRDRFGKYTTTVVNAEDANNSNWMRYVNCARHNCEQNLIAYQYQGEIYYRTIQIIPKFTELLLFYGSEFANLLGIDLRKYNSTQQYYNVISKMLIFDETVDNNHITGRQEEDDVIIDGNVIDCSVQNNDDMNNCQTIVENVEEVMDITETDNDLEDSNFNDDFRNSINDRYYNMKDLITSHVNIKDISDDSTYTEYNSIDSIYNKTDCTQTVTLNSEPQCLNMRSDEQNIQKQNVCHICNKIFTASKYLTRHRRRHIEPIRFHCIHCTFKTNVPYEYKRHIKRHEINITEDDKKLKIIGTQETQDDKKLKEDTQNDKITDSNKYITKVNTTEPSLQITCKAENHYYNSFVSDNDAKENKYICHVCNKNYAKLDNFRRHKVSHIQPVRFQCDKCSFKTNYSYSYKRHLRTHKKLVTENNIIIGHNKNKTNDNETELSITDNRKNDNSFNEDLSENNAKSEKYICHICNKMYARVDSLRRHKISHIEPIQFHCAKCNYETNYQYRYKSHLKTHGFNDENNIIIESNEVDSKENVSEHRNI